MAASLYEGALKDTYPACKKGRRNKLKFYNENNLGGLGGLKGVIVCNDEFHTLFFTPNGGCSFHNHNSKELRNMVTMDKLANTTLSMSFLKGCALLLRGLIDIPKGGNFPDTCNFDKDVSALFAKVQPILRDVGRARIKIRWASNLAEENNSTKLAKDEINSLATKLRYRVPKENGWDHPNNYQEANPGIPPPNKEGISYEFKLITNSVVPCHASSEFWTGKRKWKRERTPQWVRFTAQLNLIWFMKVAKKGLAVIDGMLVLEHTKTFPNGLMLLKVVRQGYGFTVNTVPAIYDPIRKKLSWVNTESKAEALESGDKIPRKRRTKAEMSVLEGEKMT